MDHSFAAAMRRAMEQTRGGDPTAATRTIQSALGICPAGASAAEPAAGPLIEGAARRVDPAAAAERPARRPAADLADPAAPTISARLPRLRLGKVVDLLKGGVGRLAPAHGPAPAPEPPEGARWERHSFRGTAGARDYRLYVPASLPDGPQGLVLMLHGCTQNPEDFAAGTRMNDQAERAGLILVYPEQTRAENPQGCWNWFRPGDQSGRAGEPAILAALALDVAERFEVPRDRIFAAGLSAGGAMAAILGTERPEVFSAVAVHSGLPAGAATDVATAFAAMRSGAAGRKPLKARTIILHGTADATVARANGEAVLEAAKAAHPGREDTRSDLTGRPWRETVIRDGGGRPMVAHWQVEGLGHAWSGGDARGSYADPKGPDASAEIVRFFLS